MFFPRAQMGGKEPEDRSIPFLGGLYSCGIGAIGAGDLFL